MRKLFALLVLLVLPGLFIAGAAAEEPPESPGTPTDLCTHEHTIEIYYFDHPDYVPQDAFTHRVQGNATVNIVCLDCDQVLRSEYRRDAVQIRAHTYKKGICLLCGMEEPEMDPPEEEECTRIVLQAQDMTSGESAPLEIGIPEGQAELILPGALKAQLESAEDSLVLLMMEDSNLIYTALQMGEEPVPPEGVTLRIWGAKISSVLFTSTETTYSKIAVPVWTRENGEIPSYNELPWMGNGYYKYFTEE